MTNLFDRTFFRFLVGFSSIILISFSILFFIGLFYQNSDLATAVESPSLYSPLRQGAE